MPVLGMVQRDGDVRFRMMERLTVGSTCAKCFAENADLTCRLITDDFNMYHARRPACSRAGTKP